MAWLYSLDTVIVSLLLLSDKKATNEIPLVGNSKHYSGYQLSPLGITENFEVGSDYRDLYIAAGSQKQILGISESKYVPSQVYASAPDQQVCLVLEYYHNVNCN